MNSKDIPNGTGVNNSDIESITTNKTEENGKNSNRDRDESIESTEVELRNIIKKKKIIK